MSKPGHSRLCSQGEQDAFAHDENSAANNGVEIAGPILCYSLICIRSVLLTWKRGIAVDFALDLVTK
jgi:hypothetical protein